MSDTIKEDLVVRHVWCRYEKIKVKTKERSW